MSSPATPPQPTAVQMLFQLFPFILILVVMLYIPWSAQKKERKKKDEMIKALRKDQKVCTIGGVIGTIAEVRDNEVVLVVDSRLDARLTVTKTSIALVVEQGV